MNTSQIEKYDTSWIESLALEEINMEESGYIRFTDAADPARVLEESSVNFMNKLKDRFEFYVSLFNQYSVNRDQGRKIKVFRISNTINDFMMFRNTLKLIVARRGPDVISVGFLSNSGGLFAPRIPGDQSPGAPQIHEIKAHVGPFNNVTWRYQGEVVEVESLVRFYLAEFIRNSAR
ncbi:MAG: hypothetical protein ACLGG0_07345 [Bacteriovoracia bacterium]|jgi:hypothetical protein